MMPLCFVFHPEISLLELLRSMLGIVEPVILVIGSHTVARQLGSVVAPRGRIALEPGSIRPWPPFGISCEMGLLQAFITACGTNWIHTWVLVIPTVSTVSSGNKVSLWFNFNSLISQILFIFLLYFTLFKLFKDTTSKFRRRGFSTLSLCAHKM